MSVNQISQDYNLWWTPHQLQQQQQLHDSPNPLVFAHHFQNDDVVEEANIDVDNQQRQLNLEVMFEKPLTPSDVGKLNRLVIPKQHAERHFPLNSSNGADSGGMLLTFEDEAGKLWRFRYSYWNSSQSYVLTKGWSRYVKEKRLAAGDVAVFERHSTDPDRLFIGWRRRHDPMDATPTSTSAIGGGSGQVYPALHHRQAVYPAHQFPEAYAAGVVNQGRTASFNGSTSSRTLRLFGVNVECQFESDQSEPATPDGSSASSPNGHQQQQVAYQHYTHFFPQASYYGMSNHMVQQEARHTQHRG